MVVAALIVSIVATLTAVVSVWYARQAGRSAARSTAASERTLDLERGRRKAELTPRWQMSWDRNGDSGVVDIKIALAGPPGLGRVDRMALTVRQEFLPQVLHDRGRPVGEEERAAQVWAPYRFTWLMMALDTTPHVFTYGPLDVGEWVYCLVARTSPPPWWPEEAKRDWPRLVGTVLRLWVESESQDWGQWSQSVELDLVNDTGTVEVC
jgi:hypothetical protein